MKKLIKAFILLLVLLFLVVAALVYTGIEVADIKKAIPVGPIREVIKDFTFTSSGSLVQWADKVLSKNKTDYSLDRVEGKNCVSAVSRDSASAIYFEEDLACEKNPFVSWEWLVRQFPGGNGSESLKKKKQFDFAAQFYVIFFSRFFLNTKAIQYVWTKAIPVGTVASSPYTKNVKILVLESGEPGVWKKEDRDIRADFRELFGEELDKNVRAVSFMSDSDSTSTEAAACITGIKLGYIKENGEEAAPAEEVPSRKIILKGPLARFRDTEVHDIIEKIYLYAESVVECIVERTKAYWQEKNNERSGHQVP